MRKSKLSFIKLILTVLKVTPVLTISSSNCYISIKMLTLTLITLILKPNKDPTPCSSYRPLYLINTDVTIISKSLALRLESVISSLVHPDQTGFIKGRHSSENMQRLYNIIHLYKTKSDTENGHPALLLNLDAEKAFDRVGWPFLFTSLNCFGFGSYFINWIKILYNTPSASVITNGKISKSFNLNIQNLFTP